MVKFLFLALILTYTASDVVAHDRGFAAAQNACLSQAQRLSATQPLPDYRVNRATAPGHNHRRHYRRRRGDRLDLDVGGIDVKGVFDIYSAGRANVLRREAVQRRNALMRATYGSCMRARGF